MWFDICASLFWALAPDLFEIAPDLFFRALDALYNTRINFAVMPRLTISVPYYLGQFVT